MFEIDDLGDCLSGASFLFLFPVIRAALMGPRTPIGCEGALRILYRHASMLAGNDMDPVVKPLRKEMASTVLELLSHDRSQKFIDPTPFQALICIYEADECASGPSLTAAELAPLLGEYGALGSKNCRIGSMLALATISSSHPRLVKKNPLIENRVWLNCFDENEKNQIEARKTWKVMNIETGVVLEDELKWAKFSGASWENDDSGFYYRKYEEPDGELLKELNEAPKLMFHKIGTDQTEDELIYENPANPRWGFGITVIKDSEMKLLSFF